MNHTDEKRRRNAQRVPEHPGRVEQKLREMQLLDLASETDPQGSYTGVPLLGEVPVQDADDL